MACKKYLVCYSMRMVKKFVSTIVAQLWCTTSGRMMIVVINAVICEGVVSLLLRNHGTLFTATLIVMDVALMISFIVFLCRLPRTQQR